MRYIVILAIVLVISMVSSIGCDSKAQTKEEFVGTSTSTNATESDEHEYSVQIEGSEMKTLTIRRIAELWGIDAKTLLDNTIKEFNLKNSYTVDSVLDDLRNEFKFSPAMIKGVAEKIKMETASR